MEAAGPTADIELCEYQRRRRLPGWTPSPRSTHCRAGHGSLRRKRPDALGVLSAAAELDHSVPADISLVGVNNTHLAKIGSIRLTSVTCQS
jgi:Periplasmic binding protein-like domain